MGLPLALLVGEPAFGIKRAMASSDSLSNKVQSVRRATHESGLKRSNRRVFTQVSKIVRQNHLTVGGLVPYLGDNLVFRLAWYGTELLVAETTGSFFLVCSLRPA